MRADNSQVWTYAKRGPRNAWGLLPKAIRAGEFICSWGGVTVFDSNRQPLDQWIQNYYDVTQYILQHKVGRRTVSTCPRLDINGGRGTRTVKI